MHLDLLFVRNELQLMVTLLALFMDGCTVREIFGRKEPQTV